MKLIDDTPVCGRCGGERWPTTLYGMDDDGLDTVPLCQTCYSEERSWQSDLWFDWSQVWLTGGQDDARSS